MKKNYNLILMGAILFLATLTALFLPAFEKDVRELKADGAKGCVYFFDVGQGDAALIETQQGKIILIDSGTNESEARYLSYLKSLGVEKIDVLIASHPHSDHIGAFDAVILRYDVEEIYMIKESVASPTFDDMINAIRLKNLSVTQAKNGVSFTLDGVEFKFLHPNDRLQDDTNANSAVIEVNVYGRKFLFTGDRENLTTNSIYKQLEDIDVLKAGHHGSQGSIRSKAMEKLRAEYVVFSAGKDNDYGHPAKGSLQGAKDAGAVILRTDEDGTVAFSVMEDGSMLVNTTKEQGAKHQ